MRYRQKLERTIQVTQVRYIDIEANSLAHAEELRDQDRNRSGYEKFPGTAWENVEGSEDTTCGPDVIGSPVKHIR